MTDNSKWWQVSCLQLVYSCVADRDYKSHKRTRERGCASSGPPTHPATRGEQWALGTRPSCFDCCSEGRQTTGLLWTIKGVQTDPRPSTRMTQLLQGSAPGCLEATSVAAEHPTGSVSSQHCKTGVPKTIKNEYLRLKRDDKHLDWPGSNCGISRVDQLFTCIEVAVPCNKDHLIILCMSSSCQPRRRSKYTRWILRAERPARNKYCKPDILVLTGNAADLVLLTLST